MSSCKNSYNQALGLTQRDINVTHIVAKQAVICNLESMRAEIQTLKALFLEGSLGVRQVISIPTPINAVSNITLATQGSYTTFFQLDNPVTMATTINLSIDSSRNLVGDTIYFIAVTNNAPAAIIINLDQSSFFYSGCGSILTSITMPSNAHGVFRFIYDGELWVNTDDNC